MTQTNSTPPTDWTLEVHQLFRGSAEIAKRIRLAALVAELSAAGMAAWSSTLATPLWGGWVSLVMAVLLVVAGALRLFAQQVSSYSEHCRRLSARSFALQQPLSAATYSAMVSDAPALTSWSAARLPASNLEEYYEPDSAPGSARLREMYAHSAFYSWRLLRQTAWVHLALGAAVGGLGSVIIFGVALPSTPTTTAATANMVLDIVCSLVFATLTARALKHGVEALLTARATRAVADGLLLATDAARAQELLTEYDIERGGGIAVPTLIYRMNRNRLQREWRERRKGLSGDVSLPVDG